MRHSIAEFSREHKWEIILGLVFAVLFGVAWELGKHTLEHAEQVPPDRLAAATVRVVVAIVLENDAQRQAVADWQKTHPAVIATKDFAFLKMGSGFAVSDDGWIVTARHVVSTTSLAPVLASTRAAPIVLVNYPPGIERQATVIDSDDKTDTAILKLPNAPPARFLVIGDPEEVHRLDRVFAAGYPSAADYASFLEPTITAGEISKVGNEAPLGKVFQTTAPIGPGNSGGPLLDAEGLVIGINVGLPPNKDMPIGFATSIEHAKEMLERRGVALPSSYEHQGILRQPWFVWVTSLSIVGLLLAYIGVTLRSLWRRRFKEPSDPPYADFWIRFVALVIDLAITVPAWLLLIVLLVVASDSFFPWYRFILALPFVWLLYTALCEGRWGATIGKRIAGLHVRRDGGSALSFGRALLRGAAHLLSALPLAIGFIASVFDRRRRTWHDRIADTVVVETNRRSPWAMLALGTLAFALTVLVVMAHWVILTTRARTDLEQVHAALWLSEKPPAPPAMARMIATATDRATFLRWTPLQARTSMHYEYGLDLMLAGSPRRASEAFQRAAAAPWEAFEPGSGIGHTSEAWSAAAKAGWCHFDAGDDREARAMFRLGSTSDLDVSLGLGATSLRSGDLDAARAACLRARSLDRKGTERLAHSDPQKPVGQPFYLTPPQLRAVQRMLAVCREPGLAVTTPSAPSPRRSSDRDPTPAPRDTARS